MISEDERARAHRLFEDDQRTYTQALLELRIAVKQLDNYGEWTEDQAAQIDRIAAAVTHAQARASILRARRQGLGLRTEMGQQ